MRLTTKSATLLALVILIALSPVFFPSGFYYRVGALIFVNALAVTGIVILTGWAGQISLGHAGFAGIGAYACALAPSTGASTRRLPSFWGPWSRPSSPGWSAARSCG